MSNSKGCGHLLKDTPWVAHCGSFFYCVGCGGKWQLRETPVDEVQVLRAQVAELQADKKLLLRYNEQLSGYLCHTLNAAYDATPATAPQCETCASIRRSNSPYQNMCPACGTILQPQGDAGEFKPEDLRIDTFRGTYTCGFMDPNSQTAVRITHLPTGAYVESKDERSVHKNKEKCLQMLSAAIRAKKAAHSITYRGKIVDGLTGEYHTDVTMLMSQVAELQERNAAPIDASGLIEVLKTHRAAIQYELDNDQITARVYGAAYNAITAMSETERHLKVLVAMIARQKGVKK